MIRVGLTGGLATGKTFVARQLTQLGCHVLYADDLGREVMQPGGPAFAPVVAAFGCEILDDHGAIDRARLASIVFSQPDQLAILNQIVHPAVYAREDQLMDEWAQQDPQGIGVVEAAILIETGSYRRFDRLILTVCPPTLQLSRAIQRGLTPEAAAARLAAQMPLADKIPFADYLIDTGGTEENTREQTRAVYRELRSLSR